MLSLYFLALELKSHISPRSCYPFLGNIIIIFIGHNHDNFKGKNMHSSLGNPGDQQNPGLFDMRQRKTGRMMLEECLLFCFMH